MSESEFVLRVTPPLLPRLATSRPRLQRFWQQAQDATAVAVVAPAGFGKTTLLLQWRQRWLEDDACVAWLGADALDDPARFATWLLAQIARGRTTTVFMIDDAERLPEATVRQSLQYLLYNAPANLHVVIGSRVPLALRTAELVAKGNFSVVTIDDLRLGLEESLGILERRLGSRLTLDERACVHDVTDGWAIGLQLPIAAIEHEADAAAAVRSLSARRGTLQDYFVDSLLASLPADAVEVLARIAILEHFNRELLELLAEKPVDDLLRRLVRETPIMMVGEREGWYRLHPLARDFLLGRFEQLPASQRAALHARASHWYMQQERFHDAARHALAAGDDALAQDYAARALWVLGAWGRWTKPASGWNAFPPNCCRAMPNCAWPRPSSWRSATAMPRGCGSPRRCSPIPIPHPRWPSLPCADARHRRRNREVAPQEPVSKLSAGSREHAVDRARLLGIIK